MNSHLQNVCIIDVYYSGLVEIEAETAPRPLLGRFTNSAPACAGRDRRVAHLSFFERWDSTSPSRLGSMDSADGWPTFRFWKGGIPRAYPAWDLWILRMLARSCISVGTGEDEKEARRCMSPRLPTFAKNKGAKVGHPPRDVASYVSTRKERLG